MPQYHHAEAQALSPWTVYHEIYKFERASLITSESSEQAQVLAQNHKASIRQDTLHLQPRNCLHSVKWPQSEKMKHRQQIKKKKKLDQT